jgi:hypothetical protein
MAPCGRHFRCDPWRGLLIAQWFRFDKIFGFLCRFAASGCVEKGITFILQGLPDNKY